MALRSCSSDSDIRKGLLLPSHHRTETIKGGWHAAIFIICTEFAEQFSYLGLSASLITYLTNQIHQPITEATKNVNTWLGFSSLFPLLGGFIADSYLGRFNTVVISSFIYLLGLISLTLSVSILKNSKFFFISLYLMALGDGGHKPCVQTFAADQFDDKIEDQREAKSSFFNCWYLAIVLAGTSSVFLLSYLQENVGWTVAFALPLGVWIVATAVFLLGMKRYTKESPTGSSFSTIGQVLVASCLKWNLKQSPRHAISLYYYGDDDHQIEHTGQLRFLDKAMMMDEHDVSNNTREPWRLCSMRQVEEVKLVLRLIPVWLTCLMFVVVQNQLSTFFIKQGSTMNCTIGNFQIPPASIQGIVGIVILFGVLIYDRLFVPMLRNFTNHPSGITVLQRIGVGLFFSIINMVVSALVEAKRIAVAKQYNLVDDPKSTIPMSIWWLLPQYTILGTSDAFTVVGLQELFYDQMPEGLRSLGAAAYISLFGVGSFMANAIIDIVIAITSQVGDKWLVNNLNKAHLDYFYWVLAGLSALNLCVYLKIANGFVYKKSRSELK
ncbi:hypothetical protein PIB30_047386 [Stylosanthes scabra]|uniref:Uncharacterized protein n=1 Tax=Stylosanthes scabra TaxID=79078 RepID=A0ABU6YFK6_9FABA|nr:hypothetical protein [Stylosanthes scabra]